LEGGVVVGGGGWSVGELLAARVVDGGLAVVSGGGGGVSFGELERCVVAVGERLVAAGVGGGMPVGVVGGVGFAQLVAALAVLRLGAVWVPVDPRLPVGRAIEMVADAGVAVAVVSAGARGWWSQVDAAGAVTAVVLDDHGAVVEVVDGSAAPQRVFNDDAVWVLFTSGSTGHPKGVIGSWGGLVNRLSWWWRTIPYRPGDRAVVKTRPGFVDAVSELLAPLLAGTPVVLADDGVSDDPGRLATLLADEQITHLVAVPSLLAVLYDTHHDVIAGAPLRVITSSGEPLSATLAATIRRAHPQATIVNLYGSTETSGDATAAIIEPHQLTDHVTIGRPIDNVTARILDRHRQLLPPGATGHLHIGGAALTHGYLPTVATDDHNRFWNHDGQRWYDTGDLARWTPHGTLDHLGRHDRQTKIRGVRVEPAGIEHTLLTLDHITDAAVITRHHPTRGTELTAYIVLDDPHHPLDHIRHQLRTTLPTHHLPNHLIPTTNIPRTPTGKIDHHTLTTTVGEAEPRVEPRTATEQMVAEVFAAVLGVDEVGAFDDFFGLGGHSLLATRTISELSAAFGVEVSIADLFSDPVVADLAAQMQTRVVRDSSGGDSG
jgi:amino acid adenylation domain-containing protein